MRVLIGTRPVSANKFSTCKQNVKLRTSKHCANGVHTCRVKLVKVRLRGYPSFFPVECRGVHECRDIMARGTDHIHRGSMAPRAGFRYNAAGLWRDGATTNTDVTPAAAPYNRHAALHTLHRDPRALHRRYARTKRAPKNITTPGDVN